MKLQQLTIPSKGKNYLLELKRFADTIMKIAEDIPFKISSRGWCYQLESFGYINKAQFNQVQNLINKCRKLGLLPIDFVAEEEARRFSGVEYPETDSPAEFLKNYINAVMNCEQFYTPDWWKGEKYYIQMVVEKIDLKTLFEPVCREYHIAVANSKGWSSILQRAEYARRYREAEEKGLQPVLLYCGDHDPDGLRISDFLRKNLEDIMNIQWSDGFEGYNPANLIIDRFGLNYDFIEANHLTWIDNLITGSGKNLADPSHPNFQLPYVQQYIEKYGARKCEANAIVVIPEQARQLCRETIEKYLGKNAKERFKRKQQEVNELFNQLRHETGVQEALQKALETLK